MWVIQLLEKILQNIHIEDNPANLLIIVGIIVLIIFGIIAVAVIYIIGQFKLLMVAGRRGWEALIPFYCDYVYYKVVWGIGWLFPISYIPIVKYLMFILTDIKMCKCFGKGTPKWIIGELLMPHIFIFIIAFNKSTKYLGVEQGKLFNKYI